MEKEQILEANKFFARYLEYEYYPKIDGEELPGWRKPIEKKGKFWHPKLILGTDAYLCRTHKDLMFYNKWDWIMKVYKKFYNESDLDTNESLEVLETIKKADLKLLYENLYNLLKNE